MFVKGPRHPMTYFLGQYVTTWQFKPIVKLVLSPKVGVYLCRVMGIASVYEPAGPKLEYSTYFCFYKQQ